MTYKTRWLTRNLLFANTCYLIRFAFWSVKFTPQPPVHRKTALSTRTSYINVYYSCAQLKSLANFPGFSPAFIITMSMIWSVLSPTHLFNCDYWSPRVFGNVAVSSVGGKPTQKNASDRFDYSFRTEMAFLEFIQQLPLKPKPYVRTHVDLNFRDYLYKVNAPLVRDKSSWILLYKLACCQLWSVLSCWKKCFILQYFLKTAAYQTILTRYQQKFMAGRTPLA